MEIALTDANGRVVHGNQTGPVTITATAVDKSNQPCGETASASIDVEFVPYGTEIPVSEIKIKGYDEMGVEGQVTFKAELFPANATDNKVTWSSNNDKAVSIEQDAITGDAVITALAEAENVVITAAAGGKTAEYTIKTIRKVLHGYEQDENGVYLIYNKTGFTLCFYDIQNKSFKLMTDLDFRGVETEHAGEIFDGNPEHLAPEGAIYSTYANIGKRKDLGLNFYVNWNATPQTRIYLNGRGSYADLKAGSQDLHNYGWNGSLYGGIQHTLPWKIRVSLNGGGSTPYINLQGKGTGYYYYGIGLNRSFMKEERLTLSFFCNNILEKYNDYRNRTEGINFRQENVSRFPNRTFGISLSYRLGELKANVKKTVRSISNDDVKGEGSNNGGAAQGGTQQ